MPTDEGDFALSPNHLHIWPRHKFMMIALPNRDKTFTCTLFFAHTLFEEISRGGRDAILAFFQKEFPDAVELIGREILVSDFMSNPVGNLMTVKVGLHPQIKGTNYLMIHEIVV